MFKLFTNLLFFVVQVYSHGRLTSPIPRIKNVNGGINAPIYTCLGPAFMTSSTSMRCHDTPASPPSIIVNAGDTIQVELTIEASHPGDCSLWLSYDTNVDSPQNWIKLKDYPGCFSPNGIDTFQGSKSIPLYFPISLPSCEHCVLRWEWYTVQQVSNVEFYVNCVDIKIVNNLNNCNIPSPTTQINGIEHLLYNLHDTKQKGCPFYNVYDINFRPSLEQRSRGPLEWIPNCDSQNLPVVPTVPPIPQIVYPCTNINCGINGKCNDGKCICDNGFTGLNCETPPQIQCNVNCNILNRNICQTDNFCSKCKNGFIGAESGNTLCPVLCSKNCKALNRRTCISSNKCGVCMNGFTEPPSHNKNEMCTPTINNLISLGITSQWDTGFCGRWITKCPNNRELSFIVPENTREIRAWNINNMQKIGNKIIGTCPSWTGIGQDAQGGFCAIFDIGKKVVIGNNGFFFTDSLRFRNLQITNELMNLDNYYQNVSISMNVKDILYNNINYNDVDTNLNMYSYGSSITIVDNKINDDGTSDLSLIVNCKNRIEFDASLFLQSDSIKNLNIDPNLFYVDPICNKEEFLNSGNKNQNTNLIFILFLINIFLHVRNIL